MKSKKCVFLLLLLVISSSIWAQVRLVEGELTTGTCVSTEKHTSPGAVIGVEVRFNLVSGMISPGVQLSRGYYNRKVGGYSIGERHTTFQALCDYNFFPTRKIMPFIGLGINLLNIDDGVGNSNRFVMIPRIGCEFVKWIRVSADYRWQGSCYSCFSFRVGLVIGGWNKQKKQVHI